MPEGPGGPTPLPRMLSAAAVAVALQAVAILALGGFLMLAGLIGDPDTRVGAEVGGALGVLGGVGLLLVARGLWRRRPWARAPALVAGLLAAPVAWDLVRGGRALVGVPLAVAAGVVVVALLHPAGGGRLED